MPTSASKEDREASKLRLVGDSDPSEGELGAAGFNGVDRRKSSDRRDAPTRIWDSLFGFHNRKRGRRREEQDDIYVDSYSKQDLALAVGILVLNILDAFFTLRWLGMGGGEGNPLMDMLIRADDMLFLLQKCVVVGLWLIILVIHKNFRIARFGLWGALILYAGILVYHFVLQTGPPPRAQQSDMGALQQTAPALIHRGESNARGEAPQTGFKVSSIPSSSWRSLIR